VVVVVLPVSRTDVCFVVHKHDSVVPVEDSGVEAVQSQGSHVFVFAVVVVVLSVSGTDVCSVVHTHDSVVPEEETHSRKFLRLRPVF
jgi:hypothetical protein